MGYIMEQAGGKAVTGKEESLNLRDIYRQTKGRDSIYRFLNPPTKPVIDH